MKGLEISQLSFILVRNFYVFHSLNAEDKRLDVQKQNDDLFAFKDECWLAVVCMVWLSGSDCKNISSIPAVWVRESIAHWCVFYKVINITFFGTI